ncbi:MAG: hypothetical protein ABIH21_04105 [Patescibacteria group bacterium]
MTAQGKTFWTGAGPGGVTHKTVVGPDGVPHARNWQRTSLRSGDLAIAMSLTPYDINAAMFPESLTPAQAQETRRILETMYHELAERLGAPPFDFEPGMILNVAHSDTHSKLGMLVSSNPDGSMRLRMLTDNGKHLALHQVPPGFRFIEIPEHTGEEGLVMATMHNNRNELHPESIAFVTSQEALYEIAMLYGQVLKSSKPNGSKAARDHVEDGDRNALRFKAAVDRVEDEEMFGQLVTELCDTHVCQIPLLRAVKKAYQIRVLLEWIDDNFIEHPRCTDDRRFETRRAQVVDAAIARMYEDKKEGGLIARNIMYNAKSWFVRMRLIAQAKDPDLLKSLLTILQDPDDAHYILLLKNTLRRTLGQSFDAEACRNILSEPKLTDFIRSVVDEVLDDKLRSE